MFFHADYKAGLAHKTSNYLLTVHEKSLRVAARGMRRVERSEERKRGHEFCLI